MLATIKLDFFSLPFCLQISERLCINKQISCTMILTLIVDNRLRISLDVMKKIENKDSHAFEQITENDFKKLTPDIIAAAGVRQHFQHAM